MRVKGKICRCLSRWSCDKAELNRRVLHWKRCFEEAEKALCADKRKKK